MKTAVTCLFAIVLLPALVSVSKEPDWKSTIDYIEKTGRLWGIAEVRTNADNSVTLVDEDDGLMLSVGKNVQAVTIKAGESCTLSDGDHGFITYEFKESKKGKLTFIVTDTFDARSFGDGIRKETKKITFSPYKEEPKPHPAAGASPKLEIMPELAGQVNAQTADNHIPWHTPGSYDILVTAQLDNLIPLVQTKQGDYHYTLYRLRFHSVKVVEGELAEKELTFYLERQLPTPESGIKLKELWPFQKGCVLVFKMKKAGTRLQIISIEMEPKKA